MFEAVRRCFLVALSAFLTSLTEKQRFLVQEQVPLHWLEACQVLDLGVTFLVLGPDAEGTLHQQPAQLIQVPLVTTGQQVLLDFPAVMSVQILHNSYNFTIFEARFCFLKGLVIMLALSNILHNSLL